MPENHVVDGFPLQTLLSGKPDPFHAPRFLMHYPHGRHRSNYFTTWRDGDWKVIFHALPEKPTTGGHIQFADGKYELFNLADDPFESKNLAKSRPTELRRMMKGMIAALEKCEAIYPVDDDGNELRPQLP